ncbi:GNAT family N-acetyltransferase [Staphylococcus pseudintermedius]|nr:GNAT family N-acetyltransferase [Staphylococcus pseudintermedius]
MKISQVTPNPTIALFIQTYVSERPSYTNKLPLDDEQALFTFLEEAADETGLFVVEEADEIQMLLLCISYSEDRYKVIGPIVKNGYEPTKETFKQLFDAITAQHYQPSTYYFAFTAQHALIKTFMKTIGASYTFTDYHLETSQDLGETQNLHHMIPYSKAYYRYFQRLHEDTFTHNAMTANEIVTSLDDQHELVLYMAEGILKGYLYLIYDESERHAEIKYFSSHADYRLKGIAFDLIQHAIHRALTRPEIERVYFKIRSKNHKLVERFHELGFNISSEYQKFKIYK